MLWSGAVQEKVLMSIILLLLNYFFYYITHVACLVTCDVMLHYFISDSAPYTGKTFDSTYE